MHLIPLLILCGQLTVTGGVLAKPHLPKLHSYFAQTPGCAVLYDTDKKAYFYENKSLCEKRSSPCSTFKVISALAGMEAGVLPDNGTTFSWDGTHYAVAAWNRDLTLKEAFQSSCVWYFRRVVDQVGQAPMQALVDRLEYGNRDLSAWNDGGDALSGFWLESSLQISPEEQVRVLQRLFQAPTTDTKRLLQLMEISPCFYGKTGTGRRGDGTSDAWCIGFWETREGPVYFAVRLEAAEATGEDAKSIALRIAETYR